MRLGEPTPMKATINITPLVDVVLVLLIIFMVMAPQMRKGPDVTLPNTTKPNSQGDERGRILVSVDEAGGLWINDQPVAAEHFDDTLRAAVGAETNPKIVIRGDAKLHFREVREVMIAIEQQGFHGVGLIAKRAAQKESDNMQFNNNDSGSGLQSDINITPLVDVVLVLLIIFMVVVPLLMEGYDVDIPRASDDKSAQVAESQLILSIGSAGCPISRLRRARGSRRTVRWRWRIKRSL